MDRVSNTQSYTRTAVVCVAFRLRRRDVLFGFNDVGDFGWQQYSDLWACNDGGGPPEKSNCFMPLWTSCCTVV